MSESMRMVSESRKSLLRGTLAVVLILLLGMLLSDPWLGLRYRPALSISSDPNVNQLLQAIFDADAVRGKFGVVPALIPDLLALVGDAADGYPGIAGIGSVTATRLWNQHGAIEAFPPEVLSERREQALLFKRLATLRTDAPLFKNVDELRWRGATPGFEAWTKRMEAPGVLARVRKLEAKL